MPENKKSLIVSLHDFHEGSAQAIFRQKELLQKWGVSVASVLVVPQFHHGKAMEENRALIDELTAWEKRGSELVLHGYFHDRLGHPENLRALFWTRFYTHGEAEFLDLFPLEAESRLEKGRELFARLHWNLRGFIAPAWLMAPGFAAILRRMGFTYTTTLREIIALQETEDMRRRYTTQSLCYSTRALWRRQCSLLWNPFLFSRLLKQPVIRLSLHPLDFTYQSLRVQIERLVKTALDHGFQPTTYASYVEG